MNPDFIRLKSLEGELKLSHKNKDYGITVSTAEFVIHKPHVNYFIRFADMVSIVPYEAPGGGRMAVRHKRRGGAELATANPSRDTYRIFVRGATVHNRSGRFDIGPMEFVLPIHRDLLELVAQYSGMELFR
ncbi:hypothetical protein ABEV74_15425 [Paenibacillus cisolokensis]|jgi:hypothetical protein|uniref:Uncharacterized protein n=1 Tax=Paenibacillus cisolokensis TaxID=1658519 RepID=A0ABQ4NE04_9BACL|nr:hypothetical protein [Paenibacillus cisolokensis]GIQ66169.1 hypothetical protein PACILC2_47370 [Paenibacillus cisolokensis]